jgi:hypothetical protein
MSITKSQLIASLNAKIPKEILEGILDEYQTIKHQFFLGKFQPTELNAARFCEYVLRLLEHTDTSTYTPIGTHLNSAKIIGEVAKNTSLQDTLRIFIPNVIRVLLDVRNKRDVAHVGGEVSPNFSDSVFVVHSVDWILTEVVRHFHVCSVDDARKIVNTINEVKIPIIAEFDGFVRVLNTSLGIQDKVLVILYYKQPSKVSEKSLLEWSEYQNSSRFKKDILKGLHKDAFIHYKDSFAQLTPSGILYVQNNIPMTILPS